MWSSHGTPVFSTNKTDHEITEILLKVALNIITLALIYTFFTFCVFVREQPFDVVSDCCLTPTQHYF